MKRTRAKAGFTLIELLVTIVIMVLIATGIGIGMSSGTKAYQKSIFMSDSAMLSDTVNTSLSNLLSHSQNIKFNDGTMKDANGNTLSKSSVGFVFTSVEYGVQDGYFTVSTDGVLSMKTLEDAAAMELINNGIYPDLKISNFSIKYVSEGSNAAGSAGRGGYFNVTYKITSTKNSKLTRNVSTVIRMLNN